jgi:hypothetical protein
LAGDLADLKLSPAVIYFSMIGVGLAYLNRNFQQPDEKDRKSGSNYFIGMPLPLPRLPIMLFIEARWTEVDDKQVFRLVVGVNIPLGRR